MLLRTWAWTGFSTLDGFFRNQKSMKISWNSEIWNILKCFDDNQPSFLTVDVKRLNWNKILGRLTADGKPHWNSPLRNPTPYPFIYHFWQKRYPFRIGFCRLCPKNEHIMLLAVLKGFGNYAAIVLVSLNYAPCIWTMPLGFWAKQRLNPGYIFVLFFCLLIHRLAVWISLSFHIFLNTSVRRGGRHLWS